MTSSIIPDTKDWTWVLERSCPECGFDAALVTHDQVSGLIQENAAAWIDLLDTGVGLGTRPHPQRWSPVEYACHVRDVLRLADVRVALMVEGDDPVFDNWDQDETATTERYETQSPGPVAAELGQAAAGFARRLDSLGPTQWDRTGTRSDGAHFTVASFARYLLHDPVHHLYDVAGSPPGAC